jgi:hypothetical protein
LIPPNDAPTLNIFTFTEKSFGNNARSIGLVHGELHFHSAAAASATRTRQAAARVEHAAGAKRITVSLAATECRAVPAERQLFDADARARWGWDLRWNEWKQY